VLEMTGNGMIGSETTALATTARKTATVATIAMTGPVTSAPVMSAPGMTALVTIGPVKSVRETSVPAMTARARNGQTVTATSIAMTVPKTIVLRKIVPVRIVLAATASTGRTGPSASIRSRWSNRAPRR